LIHNVNDLQKLNPKTDGVRIAHGVGTKKRIEIVAVATHKKFKVFNARVRTSGCKS
jgi:large subunit ribosomal protein L32e